jgi:NADP-dependent 3-hydroxy acid dehydrogenase YdfG
MKKIVLITGATSGFGAAIARRFGSSGFDLILTGRRGERLTELKKELETAHPTLRVTTCCFDIRNKEACFAAIDSLSEEWKSIDILVNNAGLAAGRDFFDEASIEDWDTMIDTNIKGLLYLSKAVIPLMTKRAFSHIINMGSIAGKEVYEKGNVYCATKYAVDAISQSMRIDLLKYNIKVTAIHPGAAETEFSLVRFKGDSNAAARMYEGYKPLSAEDVADVAYYVANLPPHVCINDIIITPTAQASSFYLNKKP